MPVASQNSTESNPSLQFINIPCSVSGMEKIDVMAFLFAIADFIQRFTGLSFSFSYIHIYIYNHTYIYNSIPFFVRDIADFIRRFMFFLAMIQQI